MSQDIKGKRFGKLNVIEKTTKKGSGGSYLWKCLCDCGNETYARPHDLKSGHKNSCGCYRLERATEAKKLKIKGKKFGKITVIEETGERKKSDGKIIWKCKCDCGKIFFTNGTDLLKGNTTNCGCVRIEKVIPLLEKSRKENLVENTKLDMLTSKIRKDNKTGVKGVYLNKRTRKYHAYIIFQQKRHYIGSYSSLREAKAAREEAEEKYFKPVLEKYGKTFKQESN